MFTRIRRDRLIEKYERKIERIKKKRNQKLLQMDGYLMYCPYCNEPLNLYGVAEHYIDLGEWTETTFRCSNCNKESTWIDGILPNGAGLLKDRLK